MVGENSENLGVMKKEDALKLAEEKGLDLIEVAPLAKPPVARIMSFDKYRYEESKRIKKQRAAQKTDEMRRVQIGVKTATNDLSIKAKKVNEFLAENGKVEIMLVVRGREKAHKDFAMEKLKNFLTLIDPKHKVVAPPKFIMRGIVIHIVKIT
ncbi:MAG: translation initiation factor IF-3 [Candidatus Harrisonbacteria bacterium]|nr:translation initiation factor IF-3 [Candidatus Harrisonbacteria bacterium]MBI2604265.1 translation initiation factor IF-3 [Candidatus Harrisonbacteria bacterium]